MRHLRSCAVPSLLLTIAAIATTPGALAIPSSSLARQVSEAVGRDLKLETGNGLTPEVQLLGPISRLSPNTHLRVVFVKAAQERDAWLIRLACTYRRDCIPFYVLLRSRTAGASVVLRRLEAESSQGTLSASTAKARAVLLQHAGDRVELVEQLSGLHFKTKAVCLQAGALGQRIRVRNLSTHRVLVARVAANNLVQVER